MTEPGFTFKVDEQTTDLQIANLVNDNPFVYTPTNSSRIKLIWALGGSCTLSVDKRIFHMKQDEMILIKPGQPFILNEALNFKGHVIFIPHFYFNAKNDEVPDGFSLFQVFNDQKIQLSPSCLNGLKETMKKITDELSSENLLRVEIVNGYFKIFLIYLARQLREDHQKLNLPTNSIIQHFIKLLDNNFMTHKLVQDYACLMCITPNYLNQVVKKVTGFSPSYHIRERIILEAKRKAYYSEKSMKEICYLLGFSDPAHFSKLFKKATGTNFVNYKKTKPRLSFNEFAF